MVDPTSRHEHVVAGRRLGRLPNDPSKPRLRLAHSLTGAPTAVITPPDDVDWSSRITSWPLYRNDTLGDCGPAMAAHALMALSLYGSGTEVEPTDADVVDLYRRSTEPPFDPATGANDNGVVVQDMLNAWRKGGLGGHEILLFAEVDVRNDDELQSALNLFGAVLIGADMPLDADTQFAAGQPFTPTTGPHGEPGSWGGHAMHAARRQAHAGRWSLVTWGTVHEATEAWWDRYVSEAWIVVTPEWLDAAGHSPAGLNLHGLGEAFAELTGEANPFPTPPTPTPAPTPAPYPPAPAYEDGVMAALTAHARERVAANAARHGQTPEQYAAGVVNRYFR